MTTRTRLLLSAAFLLPQAALAQATIELGEAVVTSTLIPVEVNRTGASVEVIEGEDIAGGSQSVQETLTRMPGVSVVAKDGVLTIGPATAAEPDREQPESRRLVEGGEPGGV